MFFLWVVKNTAKADYSFKNKYMQTISKKAGAIAILFVAFTVILSSFSPAPGGDKYEIYINNKLILEQFVSHSTSAKVLTLFPGNYNNKVDVRYSHCGVAGKDRSLLVKDGQNKVVKKWEFADGDAMSMKAKDIMDLKKKSQTLQLFYSSKELPQGKLLASVVMASSNYASVQ
jgi:hypothetical protein